MVWGKVLIISRVKGIREEIHPWSRVGPSPVFTEYPLPDTQFAICGEAAAAGNKTQRFSLNPVRTWLWVGVVIYTEAGAWNFM